MQYAAKAFLLRRYLSTFGLVKKGLNSGSGLPENFRRSCKNKPWQVLKQKRSIVLEGQYMLSIRRYPWR